MKLIFALWLIGTTACALDPVSPIEGLPFVVPTSVEWQGNFKRMPQVALRKVAVELGEILRSVYDARPPGSANIFSWEGDVPAKRHLRIVFTDAEKLEVLPPVRKKKMAIPVPLRFAMQSLGIRGGKEKDELFYYLIIRLDRLYFDSKSPGKVSPFARLELGTALAGHLYGYAKDQLLDLSLSQVADPILPMRDPSIAERARDRSFNAEIHYIDAFLKTGVISMVRQRAYEKRDGTFNQSNAQVCVIVDLDSCPSTFGSASSEN